MVSQTDVGSNDALRALLLLCTHDEVGDQCIFDFIRTDAEDEEESVCVVDDNNNSKETTSTTTTTIRMGGRGIARMLEIALSSPPPPSLTTTATTTTATSIVSANAWIEWYERVNYACALLANATRIERGAVEFIGYASTSPATTDDDVKPQATLLLARFLNPSFMNVNSKEYKKAIRVWKGKNSGAGGDNNDDDDEEDGGDSSSKRRMQSLSNNKDDPTIDSDNDDDYSLDDNDDSAPSSLTKTTKNISNTIDVECYDPYQHVAAVIMNIAQLERGRNFLMKLIHTTTSSSSKGVGESSSSSTTMTTRLPGEGTVGKTSMSTSHLQSLLTQLTTSPNPIRRQGIAGMIKNCCFSSDSIWWLLHVVHIDKTLLLPLAGPEELSIDEKVGLDPDYWLLGPKKVRETDALVRLHIVEALLLLLASGRQARDTLRERRTYVIIKLADMVEEDETVSDRLLECVQYLRRDEYGTEEGSSDKLAYEGYAQKMLQANNLTKSSSSSSIDNTEGFRGDDGRAVDYDNID
jgi:hypothetical protein